MPRPKVPHAEKVSVLKSELRRLRNAEMAPISKMKKPEVVAEIEARKDVKRAKAVAGLRKVESEVKQRNEKTKKDAAEVKGAVDFLTASVEAKDLVERLNAPKKRKVRGPVKTIAI
jgi:hypothetical protein